MNLLRDINRSDYTDERVASIIDDESKWGRYSYENTEAIRLMVGAIVDHDVVVGECCHINTGAIVKAGAQISEYQKLEAGEVVLGYASAIVNKAKEHI